MPVRIGGKTYRSIRAAARATGLSRDRLEERIRRGVPSELLGCKESVVGQGVRIGGVLYPSISAYARAIGQEPSIVLAARRCGIPLEALAPTEPEPPPKSKPRLKLKLSARDSPTQR